MHILERLKSDVVYVTGLRKILACTRDVSPDSDNLVPDDIERMVDAFPGNPAFFSDDGNLTYLEFDKRANRFANWAVSAGFGRGDCVALFMDNRPDYVAFWYGMSKVGVRCALINNQLTGGSLAHCIQVADAKALVMNSGQAHLLENTRRRFPAHFQVWTLGEAVQGALDLEAVMASISDERPGRSVRAGVKAGDVALYIYTSGTTGLPKAAKMSHARCQIMMRTFVPPCSVTPEDRVLLTLPLYHGTGGMCGVGCALMAGAAIVLRRKFSASSFWDDARAHGATMFVYIGEMARYLMNMPPDAGERDHKIVKAFGNGLRPDVWKVFVARTGIERLVEFYGSTEGNVSMINLDGRVGAIGRIPPILRKRLPVKLLRMDLETEEPLRNEEGFCIESAPDEPGEASAPIRNDDNRGRFEGYKDDAQTQKKILKDAFEPGDMYFRTGDLMRRDKDGYFYFIDRIGDTFRWKSENASTNEIGEVLGVFDGVELANVYGVEVPGHEGRAGMAALTVAGELDLAGLWDHLQRELPEFARPVFLRIQRSADTTGTFKFRKVELVKEGFDPALVSDPLYFASPSRQAYVPLDGDLHTRICNSAIRF